MGLTAQDQQSRGAYEDGKWYWVEHEGWHGEPPTIAPACYKAECDAWYSYVFSGISTPYLKVLGPCELPAAQKRYRLLVRNVDTIQADDEFLRDADSNWQIDPQGIFVGMPYISNVLLPARRAIEPTP